MTKHNLLKSKVVARITLLSVLCLATEGEAGILSYFRGYKLGIENSFSQDTAKVSYDIDPNIYNNEDRCEPSKDNPDKVRCTTGLLVGSSQGLGLFLQQPFRRKGLWHFDIDLGLGIRALEGKLQKESNGSEDDKIFEYDPNQPLHEVRLYLYGLFLKPHITLGITPKKYWPDLLFSFGPTAQVYWGSVQLNDHNQETGTRGVFRRSRVLDVLAFAQVELVFLRFRKNGALSAYFAIEKDNGNLQDGKIAPSTLKDMDNITVEFERRTAGFKMLMNWP